MYSGGSESFRNADEKKITVPFGNVQRSVFYRDMRPVILLMRVLGVFPYSVDDAGEMQFRVLSVVVAYSLLLQASMMAMAGCVLAERVGSILEQKAAFIGHLLDGGFIAVISTIFFIPLTYWLEVTKMLRFIGNHAVFEEEFRGLMRRDVQSFLKRRVCVFMCIAAVVVVLLEINGFVIERGLSRWWHGIPFGFSITLMVLMPFVWTSTCRELIVIARDMAQHIETHVNEFAWSVRAAGYRKLWLKLSYLTQELGQSVGFTYGTLNLIFFTIELIATYGVLSEVSKGFTPTVMVLLSASILFPALIFIQCNMAQHATDEVGSKFQLKLENITSQVVNTNRTVTCNVRSFLKTIALNPPIITSSGFVDVNRTLLVSFLSAKVTYLIVLIQFQMSSPNSLSQNKTNEARQ